MEFDEVVRRRRMVRRYRPDPVDPAVLRRVLDTARRGPSAGFSQPQRFVVAVRHLRQREGFQQLCDDDQRLGGGVDGVRRERQVL